MLFFVNFENRTNFWVIFIFYTILKKKSANKQVPVGFWMNCTLNFVGPKSNLRSNAEAKKNGPNDVSTYTQIVIVSVIIAIQEQ
jgi:hypothetical protein